jgi:DNA-binding MarR family transcriptional regulator
MNGTIVSSAVDPSRVSAVGLLRLAYERGREQMVKRIHEAGHTHLTPAMVGLFRFTSMDGRRPGEIAATARRSKQATNNMLGELERLGYLEREPDPSDGRGRIVRLTERGRSLDRIVVESGRQVEQAYRRQCGPERWALFNDILRQLIDEHG